MSEVRLLDRADLRRYLGGVTWAEIETRMSKGQIPKPLWGVQPNDKSARWDRNAVDSALDRSSAIPTSVKSQTEKLDRAWGLIT